MKRRISTGRAALPDTPAAFIFTEFHTDRAELVSFGSGRGQNRYRNPARLDIFVFVPRGEGLQSALDKAEAAAALFRSYRDDNVSCFEATVYPGGMGGEIARQLSAPGLRQLEVNNYFYAIAEVDMWFDQIG